MVLDTQQESKDKREEKDVRIAHLNELKAQVRLVMVDRTESVGLQSYE